LGEEKSGGDEFTHKHNGVDHGDERGHFGQSNCTQRQNYEEEGEQEADDYETDPDFPSVRWCIEQTQVILRHAFP
jgi:hypothetical protein